MSNADTGDLHGVRGGVVEIGDRLRGVFGQAIRAIDVPAAAKEPGSRDGAVRVEPGQLVAVMDFLRRDLLFDFLQNVTAVDWPKEKRIEVVYHLASYETGAELCVKVDLDRASPRVASVAHVWPCADWLEREQYDLLGVVFEGHPDLRRLMMPDDWVGHPMRKDYREGRFYRGMPTTRPSPIEELLAHDRAHKPDKPNIVGTAPKQPPEKPAAVAGEQGVVEKNTVDTGTSS